MDAEPGDAAGKEPKPILRLVLSLLLLAIVGVLIWGLYEDQSGSFSLFGNCGGTDFLGFQEGHWEGGSASSGGAAAAMGGALWAVAGAAVWWRRKTAVVVLAFIVFYVVALVVLGVGLSRPIWGPRECVIS
jgi:hypothetical protein